ncbi:MULTISPECIES: YceI family protein [Aquabacterium]|uniref:YceI family protein n=1 Tax=Aquabacterium TaxID=92793 RepID=UPI000718E834|nr:MULTISPECIES: YceI family protein [Aquabacterium]
MTVSSRLRAWRFGAAGLLLASLSPIAGAASPVITLVAPQSEVGFTIKQMGVPVSGRFKRFAVQTNFDPKSPQTSQVALRFELASATISADADPELGKPDWFATAKFPQATFQSTGIKALGGGKFEVAGKLSIKGSSRDVVVPMQLAQAGGVSTVTGGLPIKRLDFKVGEGDWADTSFVANDVQVKFKLVLQGVPAQ